MKTRYSVQINTRAHSYVVGVFVEKKAAVRLADRIAGEERDTYAEAYGEIKDVDVYRQYLSASRS